MASSGRLRHVALVRTDVSEEFSASFIKVRRIIELGTTLAVVTAVVTRVTTHNIPEDAILHSHCRENLKSYIVHGSTAEVFRKFSFIFFYHTHSFVAILMTLKRNFILPELGILIFQ
jgi:hypothetical protein